MKIIAFVDGSSYAASVCDHAAWAARRTGAAVEVFHMMGRRARPSAPADLSGAIALGARSALLAELAEADAERARLAQARGRLILEDAAARLREAGVEDIATRLRNEDIVATVQELEAGADLVVIGKRGEGQAFALDHLGSNVERILRSATKPVLVANRAFQPIERALVAFDGGPSAMKAVERIAADPLFAGLPCLLLHVGADTPDDARPARGRRRAAAQGRPPGRDRDPARRARQGHRRGRRAPRRRPPRHGRLRPQPHPQPDHRLDHHRDGALVQDPGADVPVRRMVGAIGFEPTTLCSQSRCATRLRYAPTPAMYPEPAAQEREFLSRRLRHPAARARTLTRAAAAPARPAASSARPGARGRA